jgi:coenzyme F420-0:L-glutamate ligase/coenzyme F420-1:gamma-L-glutamate ligase
VQPLILIPLADIPLIRQGNNLADIVLNSLKANYLELMDNDILVYTSKIVSKTEGRFVDLDTIKPGARAIELARQTEKDPRLVELILRESSEILRFRPGVFIVRHNLGFVCANAGIDHSNVLGSDTVGYEPVGSGSQISKFDPNNWVLLLPDDPDKSAAQIRTEIEKRTGQKIGVMIIDSHGRPWRLGTVGTCVGISGLPAIIDERGWKDLFGNTLQVTVVGAADELAAAASLVMGQAAEATPVVLVRGFPYPLVNSGMKDLLRPPEQDLFQ